MVVVFNSYADELLQDFLGFAPSKQAMAVVQRVTQAHAVQQQQAAASRLKHAAALTAQRCAAPPLYGRDLRQVGSSGTVNAKSCTNHSSRRSTIIVQLNL